MPNNQNVRQRRKWQLSQEELDRLKEQREKEIDASLVRLNNDIYQNEKGLARTTVCTLWQLLLLPLLAFTVKQRLSKSRSLNLHQKRGTRTETFLSGKSGLFKRKEVTQREKGTHCKDITKHTDY